MDCCPGEGVIMQGDISSSQSAPCARTSIIRSTYAFIVKKMQLPYSCPHGVRMILLSLCVAVLSGCNPDAAQFRYDDYRTRLARALKLDAVPAVTDVSPARRPAKRDMVLEQRQTTISIVDFLRLYDCALGEVIGERNSILGKVAPASQRLFNDLAFLQLAPDCIAQLRGKKNDALADKLTEAVDIKRNGLTRSIANATLASDEFSGLWRVPLVLAEFPVNGGSETIAELHYVESQVGRWLSGDYRHDPSRFENALGKLRYGRAGHLIAAAILTRAQLESANRMVASRRQGRPLCFNGKPSTQGRILRRVVDQFLAVDIQVWLSRVNAQRYDLLAPYLALEEHLKDAQSPAYRQWRDLRNTQLAWLSSASRHHVETLLPVLESCGLAPGSGKRE